MPYTDVHCNLRPVNTVRLIGSENIRSDCCRVHDVIPPDAECFLPDICKSLKKLEDRHARMFVKRPRLLEMALPLRRRCRFVPRCVCPFEKTIEIVPAELATHTRTEQLALPHIRRLQLRRQYALQMGDLVGEAVLNRLLRYAYLSLYSRLSNIVPPEKKPKKKKMNKRAKKKQKQYFDKLAKPKELPEPPEIERKIGKMSPRRLQQLSTPKQYVEDVKAPWEFTEDMKKYQASTRTKELAKPTLREDTQINPEPNKIERNALRYKPTQRVKDLSQPSANRERKVTVDLKDNPFGISANALKYKASSRIKELAEPREFENTHIRESPFAISPAALKAKASPRLIELAKPKGS